MDNKVCFDYYLDFKNYKVIVTYKRVRNINYRFNDEKEQFEISASRGTPMGKIKLYLDKFAPGLIKRSSKKISPFINNSVYIFGKLTPIQIADKNLYQDGVIYIKTKDDINKVLKKILLNYLNDKEKYYESLMGIKLPYKISVKKMKSRYASNSSYTRRLSFNISLVHFVSEIIDAIIVHELAHDRYRNHQKYFYNFVLQFCPDYYKLDKALKNTIYDYGNYNK